jgi:hypothetical protein
MSQLDSLRFLDRVQFFSGQPLLASDLQALEEYEREMRWLHNRSLHQPGVANGYAVTGEQGDRALTVQPGYAIDALGREIMLSDTHVEPVPPVASDGAGNPVQFDLTVSYSALLAVAETRAAVCDNGTGATRLRESPIFCWVRVGSQEVVELRKQIETGERILLARVDVLNCQLYRRVSIAQRRNAKPGVHPYIFSATTTAKDLDWQLDPSQLGSAFGIRIMPRNAVNTRAAGFKTTPSYFAQLVGMQTLEILDAKNQTRSLALDGFVELYNPQAESFQLSLLIPSLLFQGSDFSVEQVHTALVTLNEQGHLAWQIAWMGVET